MDQRLETFLTVCATMNYRKAAEQLHLTQPAVTKQIQALEALYGVRLFTYDSRKLRKTPQGETLEIYAISQRYQDEELRRALKRQEKTSLRIGATKSIGDYILLPQIIRFLKEPDNELFFTVDNTAHLLAQLEGGELDFVVLEGIFDKSRYESFLLRNEPYIGICAKDHPFSGCEVPMDELFFRAAHPARAWLRYAKDFRARAHAVRLHGRGVSRECLHQQLQAHPASGERGLRRELPLRGRRQE